MNLIALVWSSLFALLVTIFITLITWSRVDKEFLVGFVLFTLLFWLIDFFLHGALVKHYGTESFTSYAKDVPEWKKIVHYATVGKYKKNF